MKASAAMPKYETYKDSGIEWLGEIPSGWELMRFKFLASITTGTCNTEDKQDEGLYPFFVRSQTPEKINTYSYDGEAILTAGDGAGVGKVYHYINGKFDFHQRVYKFSDFKKVSGEYLFRYLSVNFYNVAILGTAKSTVDSLRLPLIQDFEVCFPVDKNEQRRIVNFLDQKTAQIDAAIAIKEQQIALLKERKQILIQQAVTRGVGFGFAQPTGSDRSLSEAEGNSGVPMKDSGVEWIGEIPAHWEVYANRVLFSERVESGREDLPLLSVSIHSGVSSEEISEEDNIRGRIKIEDKTKYLLVKPGDIAFNMMRAWQGAIGAVRTEGMVSPAYIVAKPKSYISAEYFEYQYRCPDFIKQMDRFSKGITDFRKRLYWDGFKQLYTVVPPQNEQLQIETYIQIETEKTNESVNLMNQQIEKLREYKTTLINSAVTGKIRITPEMAATAGSL